MLKKILAKLREKITPSRASKPHPGGSHSPSPAHPRPARGEARPERGGERSGHGRGPRQERGPRSQEGGGAAGEPRRSGGGAHEPRGRRDDHGGRGGGRRGDGAGQGRGGRSGGHGGARGGAHEGGHGRSERPVIDKTFDHPRTADIKPATPVDIPKMDTAFTALGLSDALAYGVQEMGYVTPHADPGPGHPGGAEGRRRHRLRPDRHRQDGGLRAAHHPAPGHARQTPLPDPRTHARARAAGRGGVSEIRQVHRPPRHHRLRRRGLREADARTCGAASTSSPPPRAGCSTTSSRATARCRDVDILVLDEVDRMLDMGFLPDVRRIVMKCPKERQTLFFTATLPPELEQLAGWALRDPTKVEIGRQRSPAETVSHAFYPVVASQKFELLQLLLERTEFKSVLIFSRTRMGADRIAHRLKTSGHTVGVMHSDRTSASASRRWRASRAAATRCWWRPTSPPAASTSPACQPRDQLRRARESRGLRAPHRPHRPRAEPRATPSRS
jgi:ATP-dependent RNA helicase RhlE